MAKKLIKKWFPAYESVRAHRALGLLGPRLRAADLWHLNRRSVAGAFAVGLFVAFLPIPMQMLVAATIAIVVRVNLPISVLLVWVSNPLTMPPIFYTAYTIGRWILDEPRRSFRVEMSLEWFTGDLLTIWKPLLTGSLLLAMAASLTGYIVIRLLWWFSVVERLKLRRARLHRRLVHSQQNPYARDRRPAVDRGVRDNAPGGNGPPG
ncbi:DUF2062 domain-containing protein [Thioalkalivibrio paradoxus]|uniref:ATP-binding protein n=1 Tax=Thioalkalivibrio paradoxus ARh 1 TaxID=713585 RepID=W0DMV3_9GAMM|nr:DUF2062 domain-containing protein [Thioalkalivibrio paradoxus]AHE98200.1 ATP-binding protein [Thioalkalivibrio paradoxus ARh 1]